MITHQFAFTAISTEAGASIGVAYRNQRGHYLLEDQPTFDSYPKAQEHADAMNVKLGLTGLEAWQIIASSMR